MLDDCDLVVHPLIGTATYFTNAGAIDGEWCEMLEAIGRNGRLCQFETIEVSFAVFLMTLLLHYRCNESVGYQILAMTFEDGNLIIRERVQVKEHCELFLRYCMISAAPDPVEHFIWLFGWSKFEEHASYTSSDPKGHNI